jgi:enoyl-CoA hydratase
MPTILIDRKEGYAVLTLNRPESLNALNPEMMTELCAALRMLEDDAACSAIVLTGAGRGFCAGLDLKLLSQPEGIAALDISGANDIHEAFQRFSKPVIMAVNGIAATGGFELALMGDILLGCENTRFADTHARVGIAPGWGLSQKLARIIGPSRAKEAHYTGNFISAQQASDWGLMSRLVAADRLLVEAEKIASDIHEADRRIVGVVKQMVDQGLAVGLKEGLTIEQALMAQANKSVRGEHVAQRRLAVQARGRNQVN